MNGCVSMRVVLAYLSVRGVGRRSSNKREYDAIKLNTCAQEEKMQANNPDTHTGAHIIQHPQVKKIYFYLHSSLHIRLCCAKLHTHTHTHAEQIRSSDPKDPVCMTIKRMAVKYRCA